MPQIQFPHTMKRGELKGKEFQTSAEYQKALRALHKSKSRKGKTKKVISVRPSPSADFEFSAKHGHVVVVLKGSLNEAAPELISVVNALAKPA